MYRISQLHGNIRRREVKTFASVQIIARASYDKCGALGRFIGYGVLSNKRCNAARKDVSASADGHAG